MPCDTKSPTVELDGLNGIPWIHYCKPTQSEAAQGEYKIVTEVGLWMHNHHAHAIENAGYEIKTLAPPNHYGFEVYIDDLHSTSSKEPSLDRDGEVDE